MSELEDLRRQVYTLEQSECVEITRLNGIIAQQDEHLREATAALVELKKLDLIGPLTAEEWMEFRLRDNEDEDAELLRCCANTSAIRDDVFYLMRSYASDPLLGRAPMRRIIHGINGHLDLVTGPYPAALRLHELLTRMADYYGVPMDYVLDEGNYADDPA